MEISSIKELISTFSGDDHLGKQDVEAFLDGYKPALIFEHYKKALPLVETYPRFRYNDDLSYFFHTEGHKKQFIEALNKVKRDSYEETCLTGITLGYPRKSVEFFARNCEIEEQTGELPNREYSLIMIWAGFRFSTHIDMVHGESRWLWATYTHPKAIENPLYLWSSGIDIEVPYGDFEQLEKARQYIMVERGLVPIV